MTSSLARSFQMLGQYILFLIRTRHRRGHGIHSPFVYNFVQEVLFDNSKHEDYGFFRDVRNTLRTDQTQIRMQDVGAPSFSFQTPTRQVGKMLGISSIRPKYGRLLYRIAKHYRPTTTIELGSSIGYSSLFLAKGNPDGKVITLEGNQNLCEFAQSLAQNNGIGNIQHLCGQFDDLLPQLSRDYPSLSLVFIDGNHDYKPTLKYFHHFCDQMPEGIMLFDDIYWSANMRRAWQEIVADPEAHVTIDLFLMGIIIRKSSITPGHYCIRF